MDDGHSNMAAPEAVDIVVTNPMSSGKRRLSLDSAANVSTHRKRQDTRQHNDEEGTVTVPDGHSHLNPLHEAITSQRGLIVSANTADCSGQAERLQDLAELLWTRCLFLDDFSELEEVIALLRSAVDIGSENQHSSFRALTTLGRALRAQGSRQNDLSLLEEAVDVHRKALNLVPGGDLKRNEALNELARSFYSHFNLSGDATTLENGVELDREALAESAEGDIDRSAILESLGSALYMRFQCGGDSDDLNEAIDKLRESLAAPPDANASRASALNSLANALQTRFEIQGDPATLKDAIALHHELLAHQQVDDPNHGSTLNNLANALKLDFEHHGNHAALTEAITHHRAALASCSPGDAEYVMFMTNLANTLVLHFETTGEGHSLDEAVRLHREALRMRPTDDPLRGWTLLTLGTALDALFEQQGDMETLREAIGMHREALALHPEGHEFRRESLNNLASVLQASFEASGDVAAMAESISLYRAALVLHPVGHPDRPSALDNLAAALQMNFEQYGDYESLTEAVRLHEEALGLFALHEPRRLSAMNNLGTAQRNLYIQFGDEAALNKAIGLFREILRSDVLSESGGSSALNNLANALQELYENKKDLAALAEAIQHHREALELCPEGRVDRTSSLHNLATALLSSFDESHEIALLNEAMRLLEEALQRRSAGHPDRTESLFTIASVHFRKGTPFWNIEAGLRYMTEGLANDGASARERLLNASRQFRNLERVWSASSELFAPFEETLLDLYVQAVRLLPRAASFALGHSSRLGVLGYADEEICRHAAVRAVLLGRTHLAVELLETGRGVLWSQALRLRNRSLEGVPVEDRKELQRLLHLLERGSHRPEEAEDDAQDPFEDRLELNKQFDALVARAQAQSGQGHLFQLPTYRQLTEGLPDGIIVMLVSADQHHLALIIDGRTREANVFKFGAMPARPKFEAMLGSLPRDGNIGPDDIVDAAAGRPTMHKAARKGPTTFEDCLSTLWKTVVKPIINTLALPKASGRDRPRIFWCPSGELTLLPLHAAGIYRSDNSSEDCASDYVVSSYIPTLSSLRNACRNYQPLNRDHLTAVLVAAADAPGLPIINSVREEVQDVQSLLQAASIQILNDVDATVRPEDVLQHLEKTFLLHMATHGQQKPDPFRSRFALREGDLTIADLMRLELPNAVFAFLSACETARGRDVQPDQVVHLAASMLFCGFRSVIATFWTMRDIDGPKVARWVYERLLEKETLLLHDIAYALDEAIGRLRVEGASAAQWATYMHMGG